MEENLKGHYAGFVSRLLAFSIDIGIVTILLGAIGWLVRTVSDLFQLNFIPSGILPFLTAGLVSISVLFVYFIFFWTLIGQTPGKMLLGLRVISIDGSDVSFWQAVRRFIGYFISFILYLGYLWVLIDNRRQGWHDKIANTYVIYAWDARFGSLLAKRVKKNQGMEEVEQQA